MKVKVNGEAIKNILDEAGVRLTDACIMLGRSHSYLHYVRKENTMDENMVKLFCKTFGVPEDEFVVEDAPEEKTIIKDAIKEVLMENVDEINKILYCSIYGAVKKALREQ